MYQSPLHILPKGEAPEPGLTGEEYLLRLRKKILVELNLDNAATIEINGRAYSKDEIIRTIDLLLNDAGMEYHLYIYRNEQLLDFLENKDSRVAIPELSITTIPEALQPNIYPLLQERISFTVKKAIDTGNFEAAMKQWQEFAALPEMLLFGVKETINARLLSLGERIEANGEEVIRGQPEFKFLQKEEVADFLNALSEEFTDTLDTFVMNVLRALNSHRGHPDRKHMEKVYDMLRKVKCSPVVMVQVLMAEQRFKRHTTISDRYTPEPVQKTDWTQMAVYGVIVVVAILLRVAMGGSSSSSDKYAGNTQQMEQLQKIIEQTSQSLKGMEQMKNNPLFMDRGPQYRVLIKNRSGHDLLLRSMHPSANLLEGDSYYFKNGKTDTLLFHEGEPFMLYCTDSKSQSNMIRVLYKTYTVELKDKEQTGKLPLIKLDAKFAKDGKVENDKLRFTARGN